MQDWNLVDQRVGLENAGLENDGPENDGLENAGLENAGLNDSKTNKKLSYTAEKQRGSCAYVPRLAN